VVILQNAKTIPHLCQVDVLQMGVSPGFHFSKACCLYADRLDDNRVALMGPQSDEFDMIPHRQSKLPVWGEAVKRSAACIPDARLSRSAPASFGSRSADEAASERAAAFC
jgi:hypothetical protein